jgi:hypothetical protein
MVGLRTRGRAAPCRSEDRGAGYVMSRPNISIVMLAEAVENRVQLPHPTIAGAGQKPRQEEDNRADGGDPHADQPAGPDASQLARGARG